MKGLLNICLLLCCLSACHPKLQSPPAASKPEAKSEQTIQRFPEGFQLPDYKRRKVEQKIIDKKRIEPPFWWTGMQNRTLELLIYDQLIKTYQASIDYPGVTLKAVHKVENRNYLFLELEITPAAKPGTFKIVLNGGDHIRVYDYELKAKPDQKRIKGLGPEDCIYLLMPDRFANGDPSNDSFEDMKQQGIDRSNVYLRHGGDLKGIMEHLDYLKDLGVTAIWINPLLENDQPYESYHGYAITDHYNIDKRFGNNEDYKNLVDACHQRGMKVIMDIIHNHVGDQHWFIRDLPDEDWIHQFDTFTKTNYREATLMDPYVAESDLSQMSDGWFDHHMPDLNQRHPRLARYLTQNNIWWVNYTGLDSYRVDTYYYPDQKFMADWAEQLLLEFPKLNIFGETWVHDATVQAYFTGQSPVNQNIDTHLPAVTDFQLHFSILEAVNQKQGWTSGLSKIYTTLSKDFLYQQPFYNVTFLDNHDLNRFYSVVGEDLNKFKSGLAILMTTRGIPMLYYGTEVLLRGVGGAFGEAGRIDFPGGWPGDAADKFELSGRTANETKAFDFIRKLANYRKATPALQTGKLLQFIPENDIYVYFRYDEAKTVMVIVNTSNRPQSVITKRFAEKMEGFTKAMDVINGETINDLRTIGIDRNSTKVLEMMK